MNRLVLTAVGGALDDTVSLDVGPEGSPGAGACARYASSGETAFTGK
jgi:hypothetical protein